MKLEEIRRFLEAKVICGENCLQIDILSAYGADLLSDILDFSKEGSLLLTGLNDVELIQAANDGGIAAIVFVRGKNPIDEVVALAVKFGIPLLQTKNSMYESCGILYSNEIKACPLRASAIGVC